MINVAIVTLGCDKNTVHSEKIRGYLSQSGYKIVQSVEDANIVMINTCGFIEDAKKESLDIILDYVKVKKKRDIKIVVMGCLAQRYSEVLREEIPEIDAILGINVIAEIPNLFQQLNSGKKIVEVNNRYSSDDNIFIKRSLETPLHYAYLQIAEGCDNCCTYCSIPSIKGPYRSRKLENILQEAQYLADKGIKELILIAQDITYYGLDIYGNLMLAKLLKELESIDSLKWIRLLYCYPKNITNELINVIARSSKICNYIDIPLQHASSNVLKRMGRTQHPDEIKKLIEKMRSQIPELTLRTTFIIGFPGETENDFKELTSFLDEVKFDWAGFFRYSQEEGTPAYSMKPIVPVNIVKKRFNQATALQRSITRELNMKQLYKRFPIVIEGESEQFPGMFTGRSYRNAPEVDGIIHVKGNNLAIGDWVECEITEILEYDLIGEVK